MSLMLKFSWEILFFESGDAEVFKADKSKLFASNKRQIDNHTLMLDMLHSYMSVQGMKLIFFSVSHLAPKLFKVVANLKKSVTIYKDRQNLFLILSAF